MSPRLTSTGTIHDRETAPVHLRGMTIGVVGLGQIGGSVVRCLSRLRPELDVVGHDLRADLAPRVRTFCSWCDRFDGLVAQSDVVVLAVPVPASIGLLPRIARLAQQRTARRRLLVCDVGTVKASIVAAAARYRADYDFVGLHPVAGGERNGWETGDRRLFAGRPFVFCPAGRRQDRLARELIGLLGGRAIRIDAPTHDQVVAETIGLPHLVAFAAAGIAAPMKAHDLLRGRSWGSLTRVAASDPAMVAGFFQGNGANQVRVLRRLRARLDMLERLLQQPSGRALERWLARWRRQG